MLSIQLWTTMFIFFIWTTFICLFVYILFLFELKSLADSTKSTYQAKGHTTLQRTKSSGESNKGLSAIE